MANVRATDEGGPGGDPECQSVSVALAGNPNSGKSCLFNALTGGRQTVGNYPGVTVEKVEGRVDLGGFCYTITDLPGTYSLTAYSLDERVARTFIVDEAPDVVVNVLDASNLERNLYLTTQLLEMEVPLVVALNMADIARNRGYAIDVEQMSRLLGVPVVETVGNRGEGVEDLLKAVRRVATGAASGPARTIHYGPLLEEPVRQLTRAVRAAELEATFCSPRWVAVKLVEEDEEVIGRVRDAGGGELVDEAAAVARAVEAEHGEDVVTIVAEQRYGFAAGVVRECIRLQGPARQTLTDQVDAVVCNRGLGFLFVALCIYLVFKGTFLLADSLRWLPFYDAGFAWRTPTEAFAIVFDGWLPALFAGLSPGPLRSLLLDGILGGVGGVMGFVPLIFFMFFFLGIVEDSGYIARIAFVLDRVLRVFGLQGKSIMAMIVSGGIAGGCAVPGIFATRTLREERDRLTTMLVAPFMNCGAKMPTYMLLIGAFFAAYKGEMLILLVAISWATALGSAFLLRRTVIRGEQTPFVMELPAYHLPHWRSVFAGAGRRTWLYMKKAGTLILAATALMWALMYFPHLEPDPQLTPAAQRAAQLEHSLAGRVGRLAEPVSRWAGFDWRTNIALVGGFAAKEVVVSTLGTAYSLADAGAVEEDEAVQSDLARRLRRDWTPLQAFALMIFVMLYAPCVATVAAMRRESGAWKWPLFSLAYSTVVAFALAVAVYQIGGALSG